MNKKLAWLTLTATLLAGSALAQDAPTALPGLPPLPDSAVNATPNTGKSDLPPLPPLPSGSQPVSSEPNMNSMQGQADAIRQQQETAGSGVADAPQSLQDLVPPSIAGQEPGAAQVGSQPGGAMSDGGASTNAPQPLPGIVPAPTQPAQEGFLDNLFEPAEQVKPAAPIETVLTPEEAAEKERQATKAKAEAETERKRKAAKKQVRTVPLPKEYRLPPEIYKKKYDLDNHHLPIAQYEHEYDAQLFLAAASDNVNVARSLLKTGRSVEMRNPEGDTLLIYAIRNGAHNVSRMLLGKGADPNAHGGQGLTPLQYAMLLNRPDLARALLQMGADPNVPDMQGNTPLMQSVLMKDRTYTAGLIQNGAVVNMPNLNGRTPLHVAAENNQPETLAMLIEAGGDVNAPDAQGDTPLILAARSGARESARILLNMGAAPTITNHAGRTAEDVARQTGNTQTLNTILSFIVRQELGGYAAPQPVESPVPADQRLPAVPRS